MALDDQQRIDFLLDEALELQVEERKAFLTRVCPDEPTVRAEVELLLDHHDQAEAAGFLDAPARSRPWDLENTKVPEAARPDEPPMLQGFVIETELGRGGMGVVYRARQLELKRLVAIKMIRAGVDTDPEAAMRFRRETEAVAQLQHTNLVQIYEVGVHERRPFCVLEYVAGPSLAQVLAGNPLPARSAAELVRTLAEAIHYAHQRGIIHRDLKPANILLQIADLSDKSAFCNLQSAIPKVTDFGLAKRLEAADGPTRTGDIMGTPSYMAPEQAEGLPAAVGPATDVYALGAVLYEMLTGRPPFKAPSVLDTLMLVRSQEPVPPRRLQPNVPRDLETICLKCLEKNAPRRYPSAQDLADDLGRLLRGEPIRARAVGRAERLWRWCRRKPLVAGLAAALVAAVLIGFGGVTWQLLRAEREWDRAEHNLARSEQQRRRAEREWDRAEDNLARSEQQRLRARRAEKKAGRRFLQVRELANRLLFDFYGRIENLAGATRAREALVKTALQYLDSLTPDAGDDATLLRELAVAYARVGDVQGYPGRPNLGDTTGALASYRKGLATAKALISAAPKDSWGPYARALCLERMGTVLVAQGQTLQALALYQQSLQVGKKLTRNAPNEPTFLGCLSVCCEKMGDVQAALGHTAEALGYYRQSLAHQKNWARMAPQNAEARDQMLVCTTKIAGQLRVLGHTAEARTSYQQALDLLKAKVKRNLADAAARRQLTVSYTFQGEVQEALGRADQALASYQQGLALNDTLAQADPDDIQARRDRSVLHNKIGHMQLITGRTAEALASFQRSLQLREQLARAHPDRAEAQRDWSVALVNVADMRFQKGHPKTALAQYRQSLHIRTRLAQSDPKNIQAQIDLGENWARIAEVLAVTGQTDQALANHRENQAILQGLAKSNPDNADVGRALAVSYHAVADVEAAKGHGGKAIEMDRRGLDILGRLLARDTTNACLQRDLAVSYTRVGDRQAAAGKEAEALMCFEKSLCLQETLARADRKNVQAQLDVANTAQRVGETQAKLGRSADALASYQKGLALGRAAVRADPQNVEAQLILSVALDGLGDMRRANAPEALKCYEECLAIRQRLAGADPGNTQIQFQLSSIHDSLGNLRAGLGQIDAALANYQKSLDILTTLVAQDSANSFYRRNCAAAYSQVGLMQIRKASVATSTGKERLKQWRAARQASKRAYDLLTGMQRQGILPMGDAPFVTQLAATVARCDRAIRTLEKGAAP